MGEIGRGNFGSVDKMLHIKTNTVMAVKVSTLFKDLLKNGWFIIYFLNRESAQLWKRRNRSNCWWTLKLWWEAITALSLYNSMVLFSRRYSLLNYLNIHKFLILFFDQGDCWICMELMDISLDKFYRFVHHRLQQKIPESILGKIALAVITFFY